MDKILEFLADVSFGEPQTHGSMTAVPLIGIDRDGIDYMVLVEAIASNLIDVTETDKAGTVSNLKVINKGDIPVLAIGGEELIGAKQNRILNTSILFKEKSEVIIPVSCTEQGRWSYRNAKMEYGDAVAPMFLRKPLSRSVTDSIRHLKTYRSDQSKIWSNVNEVCSHMGVKSETSAMRDVQDARREDIGQYLKSFDMVNNQVGTLVFLNGHVAGFDILSRPAAYAKLHPALIRSYALDAMLSDDASAPISLDEAHDFVDKAMRAEATRHQSPGYGWDYRYQEPEIAGTALYHQEAVIHCSFFKTEPDQGDQNSGDIVNWRSRRDFIRY